MKRWFVRAPIRNGDGVARERVGGVRAAYAGLSVAARSGSVERQDAAWEALRAAAGSARAGSVLIAMELVEESHHGGPLTHPQAVRRLTDAVADAARD